ncbi:MAG: aldo/keto reductase [Spirochaetales bacterium]|nr:aldo/keto reductase [Spirochaetales bacterium]
MKYSVFGKTGKKVSVLGFGCMRFPVKDGNNEKILEDEIRDMLACGIEGGINYLDTAYPYHGGKSEEVVGKVLENGYRDRVILATKMPCWLVEKPEDFDKYLDIQLERLRTDRIDYYLIHGIFTDRWRRMKEMGVFEWSEKARADGRIRGFGFSFHDTAALFKEVIDAYDAWDLCQIQYNYLNENFQAGTEGLLYAAQRNIPVVVMEPLFGGALAAPPEPIKAMIDEAGKKPADLALQWLWDKPEVTVVLSGMGSLDQVKENIASAGKAQPGSFSREDRLLVERIREAYTGLNPIPCTKCRYCMPCPSGVDIPRNFELYNLWNCQNPYLGRALYSWHFDEGLRASACTACGTCEEQCPQHIPIREWLKKVHEALLIKEGI